MKLCREMVEAMGGAGSPYYVRFRTLACEAYNILRKSADLILSLFHLMAGASIEAIRANPENAMLKLQAGRVWGLWLVLAFLALGLWGFGAFWLYGFCRGSP
jgi:phosphatidylinositol kinase/protein kinase (PI-3  family)